MSVAPFEWYPLTEGKNHTPSAAEWGIDRARGLLGGETQKERQLTELTPGATKPLLNRGSYAHVAVIKSDVFVSPPRRRDIDIRKALGQAGADLFMGMVRDGDAVGVYWSRTIQALTASLQRQSLQRVDVVQVGGNLRMPSMDLSTLTSFRELRESLQAKVHMIGHPIVLKSAGAKLAIEREESVSRVMELARRARIVLYSVGSVSSVATLLHSPLINEDEREFLIEHSVGEICAHFIDEDGRVCLPDLNNRTLGISLPDLRHNEQKILVAGGSDKLQAVYAALLRGYANRLVIDTVTARKLHALTKKKQGK